MEVGLMLMWLIALVGLLTYAVIDLKGYGDELIRREITEYVEEELRKTEGGDEDDDKCTNCLYRITQQCNGCQKEECRFYDKCVETVEE